MRKFVHLKNVKVIARGVVEHLNCETNVKSGIAAVIVGEECVDDEPPIAVNGVRVSVDELPQTLENTTLEVLSERARILYATDRHFCVVFTNGEYGHIVCEELSVVVKLLSHVYSKC